MPNPVPTTITSPDPSSMALWKPPTTPGITAYRPPSISEAPPTTLKTRLKSYWNNNYRDVYNYAGTIRRGLTDGTHGLSSNTRANIDTRDLDPVARAYYNWQVNPGHVDGSPNVGLGSFGGQGRRDQMLGLTAMLAQGGILGGTSLATRGVGASADHVKNLLSSVRANPISTGANLISKYVPRFSNTVKATGLVAGAGSAVVPEVKAFNDRYNDITGLSYAEALSGANAIRKTLNKNIEPTATGDALKKLLISQGAVTAADYLPAAEGFWPRVAETATFPMHYILQQGIAKPMAMRGRRKALDNLQALSPGTIDADTTSVAGGISEATPELNRIITGLAASGLADGSGGNTTTSRQRIASVLSALGNVMPGSSPDPETVRQLNELMASRPPQTTPQSIDPTLLAADRLSQKYVEPTVTGANLTLPMQDNIAADVAGLAVSGAGTAGTSATLAKEVLSGNVGARELIAIARDPGVPIAVRELAATEAAREYSGVPAAAAATRTQGANAGFYAQRLRQRLRQRQPDTNPTTS